LELLKEEKVELMAIPTFILDALDNIDYQAIKELDFSFGFEKMFFSASKGQYTK
jgi:hypothetical protein